MAAPASQALRRATDLSVMSAASSAEALMSWGVRLMTWQFAVSTVTAGSDTRGIGHDNTGHTRTDRGQAARSSELGSRGLSRRCEAAAVGCGGTAGTPGGDRPR